MVKKIVLFVIAALIVIFAASGVGAQEKVEFPELRIASVRGGPVDVPIVVESQINFWADVIAGLIRTGAPFAAFGEETSFGLEATVKEGLFWDKLDWVAGFTFKNEERGKFATGVQYTGLRNLEFKGGIWEIFKRCDITGYLIEGELYIGIGYELIRIE